VAREWRRLLVQPERLPVAGAAGLPLQPEEAHYLRRVLRLRPGEQLAVVDGAGRLWSAVLEEPAAGAAAAEVGSLRLEQPLQAPLQQQPAARPQLQLAVALPRLDADVLLRMVCELGIDGFTPLRAARSVAADRLKPQRQQAILREALEQCERLWLPQLELEQSALAWLAVPPAAGQRCFLATTRRQGLMDLEVALAAAVAALPGFPELAPGAGVSADAAGSGAASGASAAEDPMERITVAIGPEGGWTPDEEATALQAGWQPVGLGQAILRTSTAAVSAAALMASWRRRLSCGTSLQPWP
jgi:16S rRNA (uracil1498-N3)-methyltransferase